MSMKTILVPMENHDMRSALETALLLGQRNNSYIEGFALRWQVIELFTGIDEMGGIPLDRFKEDLEEEAKKAKQIFEIFMQEHGVPRSTEMTGSVSFGWLDRAAEGEGFIGNYGRVFDVIVMNRRDANSGPMHDRAIESGLRRQPLFRHATEVPRRDGPQSQLLLLFHHC
ncbi:MAG: hypothetical protein ACM3IH_22820 [Sphingobacteriales bacterium]